MVKSWGIQRKNSRVALTVPIRVEPEAPSAESPVTPFNAVAEDISRDGFRMKLSPDEEIPVHLQVNHDCPVVLVYGKRRLKATIKIMWRNETHMGIQFVERDKGWIIS
ncbi:MAG: PilZ domain-containing protein [Acidobacteria bacterium]|nr:PilZ domain-containing protein [Acidobacteriota bacterium]